MPSTTCATAASRAGSSASAPMPSCPRTRTTPAGAAGAATTGPQAAPQMLSYTARIEIEREHLTVDGREVRLVPGMSVTADLLTGERRVLEYVLQPVLRYASEGMRER